MQNNKMIQNFVRGEFDIPYKKLIRSKLKKIAKERDVKTETIMVVGIFDERKKTNNKRMP